MAVRVSRKSVPMREAIPIAVNRPASAMPIVYPMSRTLSEAQSLMISSPLAIPLKNATVVARKVGNSRSLSSSRPPISQVKASTSRITVLRKPATLWSFSKIDSGFSTTPKAVESTGSRWISGRVTSMASLLGMLHLLCVFDFTGKEHLVYSDFQCLGGIEVRPIPRHTGQFRLDLSRMGREQHDSTAASDPFG